MNRFLKNAIREGVSRGIGDAIGKAVQEAVEPKAAELVEKANDYLEQAVGQANRQTRRENSDLQNALSNLERSMQGYATKMSKNMKICPACGEPTTAEKAFCPFCGAKLPTQTVAEEAVCSSCGKQNDIGTKFCEHCGAKLPATIRAEQAQLERDAAELARWDEFLPQYPKWSCGGTALNLEEIDPGCYIFSAGFNGSSIAAKQALEQYRQILMENGFRQAGQYPDISHLYRKVGEACYHVDTEHCFEGDPDRVSVGFDVREPYGGFDYVKPEPRKQVGLKDLFRR